MNKISFWEKLFWVMASEELPVNAKRANLFPKNHLRHEDMVSISGWLTKYREKKYPGFRWDCGAYYRNPITSRDPHCRDEFQGLGSGRFENETSQAL